MGYKRTYIPAYRPRSYKIDMSIERKAKHCSDCGEYKDHSEFSVHSTNRDGRHNKCSKCRSEYQYQGLLNRERLKGNTRIRDCEKCDRLFTFTRLYRNFCPRCSHDI